MVISISFTKTGVCELVELIIGPDGSVQQTVTANSGVFAGITKSYCKFSPLLIVISDILALIISCN